VVGDDPTTDCGQYAADGISNGNRGSQGMSIDHGPAGEEMPTVGWSPSYHAVIVRFPQNITWWVYGGAGAAWLSDPPEDMLLLEPKPAT
jgi:hypothetical protein